MKGDNISEHKGEIQYWAQSTVARDHSVFDSRSVGVAMIEPARDMDTGGPVQSAAASEGQPGGACV